MKLYDYAGVIHLHSDYSFDGHVALDKIIEAARQSGIDFLMLTDHDHLKAREDGWEGWNGKVLLIVGQEISPRFNHYLGFNMSRAVQRAEDALGIPPQQYVDEVNYAGGFGFIAHPDHEGTKKFHVKHYPWVDWSVQGYTGISIWDFMTDWQSSLAGYLPSLLSFFFPAFFLKGPRRITLERWDLFNQTKKVVGIGELDNHASVKKIGWIKFIAFPFKKAFQFIRTHICTENELSGDKSRDIPLLFSALRYGRCYAAMEYFAAARGFCFFVVQRNKNYSMGDSVIWEDKTQIVISLPLPALVRVVKNGALLFEGKGKNISLPVREKGIYRVEAYLQAYGKYRPWIFSNPVFVR